MGAISPGKGEKSSVFNGITGKQPLGGKEELRQRSGDKSFRSKLLRPQAEMPCARADQVCEISGLSRRRLLHSY
jgi:hypothetical protein